MDVVMQGNVLAAIHAYQDAQTIDTGLEIAAWVWDLLCWFGSLHNQATEILFASEKATQSNPDWPSYRETRGLVRALTDDLQGAIEDFESVIENEAKSGVFIGSGRFNDLTDYALQRQEWIESLRSGRNPFTPELLEALREIGKMGNCEVAWEAADDNG
jgi:hypothetical protein